MSETLSVWSCVLKNTEEAELFQKDRSVFKKPVIFALCFYLWSDKFLQKYLKKHWKAFLPSREDKEQITSLTEFSDFSSAV